jgi:hypothetical protein
MLRSKLIIAPKSGFFYPILVIGQLSTGKIIWAPYEK